MWRMLVVLACLAVLGVVAKAAEELKQTNLLLIMFDDLRPELSFYGRDYVVSPNFERLASRSVIFDHAYCQVAVCNPSRNSLLTGLRPDTTGSYNFDRGFHPHIPFPAQLVSMGYNTAASGKIAHWVNGDKNIWNFDHWENGWYDYQGSESRYMNSSVMPDKVKHEHKFRDYEFASKAIEQLRHLAAKPQYFMSAVGFKLPHLDLHIPHKYYELYKNKRDAWKLNRKELRYPASLSEISYRCCAEGRFRFMREEGSLPHNRSAPLMDINRALPQEMHDELMMGYLGGISYLDTQIGRILDVMDELKLWENTTVVLTSDHGMHNGEKGLWEKWTLFEEATRIPLLIAHPQSPFKGQHYAPPVESVDVYATLNELLHLPYKRESVCNTQPHNWVCRPLDGKSLASVVLGVPSATPTAPTAAAAGASTGSAATTGASSSTGVSGTAGVARTEGRRKGKQGRRLNARRPQPAGRTNMDRFNLHFGGGRNRDVAAGATSTPGAVTTIPPKEAAVMPRFAHDFAISQVIRCAPKDRVPNPLTAPHRLHSADAKAEGHAQRSAMWNDCETRKHNDNEISLLGYSMRTLEYRYTAYYHYDRKVQRPVVSLTAENGSVTIPYEEELFDHKNESLADFTHRETVNLAYRPGYAVVVSHFRTKLAEFVIKAFANVSPHKKM